MSNITELIQNLGNAKAQAIAARGQIYGGVVKGLGDLASENYKQRQLQAQQAQEQEARAQSIAASKSQVTLAQNQDTREGAAFTAQQAAQHLATQQALHTQTVQALGAVRGASPDQQQGLWTQTRVGLINRGIAKPDEVPAQYPGNDAVDAELRGLMTVKEQWDVAHPKPVNLPEGGTLVNPDTGAMVLQGTPKPKSLQSKSVLLDGKPSEVNFDPATGQYQAGGQDVTARVRPMPPASVMVMNAKEGQVPPGDWAKTGGDFLSTIPVQWRKTVEKIANYDEDPTKVSSMRSGMRETLSQWINQVNPAYDQSKFAIRSSTRKAFTTGTQGQQINAINTALGHLDQLTAVADQLQSGGFVPGNRAYNAVKTMFGSDKVTNFDTLKDALAGEVDSVLAKSGSTVSGREDAKRKINAANSPQQLAGYVKTLIPLMGSKLNELNYQFHQAMGDEDTYSALSPESKAILTKHGFDPANPAIGQSGGGAPMTKPIPGIPGAEATSMDGGKTWTRSK